MCKHGLGLWQKALDKVSAVLPGAIYHRLAGGQLNLFLGDDIVKEQSVLWV